MKPKKLALAIIAGLAALGLAAAVISPPAPNKGASVEFDRWNN
jgi:hypothetical protein